jgi:hypothetical protein
MTPADISTRRADFQDSKLAVDYAMIGRVRFRPRLAVSRSAMMRMPKNLGIILLAIWLILYGVFTAPFLHISFTYHLEVMALLAIAAGVFLLVQR